jgi:hypothetical protein
MWICGGFGDVAAQWGERGDSVGRHGGSVVSTPVYYPLIPGLIPSAHLATADCQLQIGGCPLRWQYGRIGCPLGGDSGRNPEMDLRSKKIYIESFLPY